MRLTALALIGLVSVTACSPRPAAPTAEPTPAAAAAPDDDLHRGLITMKPTHEGQLETGVTLADDVRAAWSAIRVRVTDRSSGDVEVFDVALGDRATLGDSGLALTAVAFVPDFVMDERGITSRSAEPANPAAQVVIVEGDGEPFAGWLFAAMPEIHPFPHDRYEVVLQEGVPAG